MASFRRRKRDGKVQQWARKVWDAETGKYDYAFEWLDVPDDEPERFMEIRDPKTEGMILITVDEFDDDGPITMKIDDFLAFLDRAGATHH